jgi:hypothetical protein
MFNTTFPSPPAMTEKLAGRISAHTANQFSECFPEGKCILLPSRMETASGSVEARAAYAIFGCH